MGIEALGSKSMANIAYQPGIYQPVFSR